MASLREFKAIQAKFSGLADFVTVYIAEAHPSERPNFSGNIDIATHKVMEERVDAAKQLEDAMEGDDNIIVVDTMENLACDSYAALPERLYIVLNSMIVLEGGVGPFGYNLAEIETYLETFSCQ